MVADDGTMGGLIPYKNAAALWAYYLGVFALIPVVGVIALGALFYFNPATSNLFPPCPFHMVTGLYCPGCGSLRALHKLLHGDLRGAFALNPLMIASLPLLGWIVCRRSWRYRPWLPWVALGVLVTYAVVRNCPVWPLLLLAPR